MSPVQAREPAYPLQGIIDAMPTLIWSGRRDGEVDFLNRRWLDYTGLSREEATGWGWADAIHPEDRDGLVAYWQALLAAGQPGETEARLRRRDGQYRWFLFRADPMRDVTGTVVRWCGSNTDIDDRKRLEQALAASEQSLRSILDSIPGFVGTLDVGGEIEWVNKPLLDYFGMKTVEELRHWRMSGAVHPDDVPRTVRVRLSSFATGAPMEVEQRLRRADGIYRWFLMRALPMRDEAGSILGWCTIVTDIHDRKTAEHALREADAKLARAAQVAAVAELAASIAHEVNQPLAAVVTNAHACLRWLTAQPPNLQKAVEAAERIVRDGKDAGEVVSRIRSLFKRAEVQKSAFDINEVIDEVARMLATEACRRRVAVESDLEMKLPQVLGDRVQLQQVVFNLLTNALDALDGVFDRPKTVSIRSAFHTDSGVLVSVCDNGFGLEDAGKVFEPFLTTKKNGMGMGLAICRSIIDAHSGKLWATRNEGPGATFYFSLPPG